MDHPHNLKNHEWNTTMINCAIHIVVMSSVSADKQDVIIPQNVWLCQISFLRMIVKENT